MRLCAFCFEVGSWQVVSHKHCESGTCCTLRSYLWNCNTLLCSRHEAASKDFSKIGCVSLWSLSTATFTYGNVLAELRARKGNGWALFFNSCILLLNLWECPGGKGNCNWVDPKPFHWRYILWLPPLSCCLLQDKMYLLISSEHCSWFVVPTNLVSLVLSCCCKMRVHTATLDVSDLSDRGILKNDLSFSVNCAIMILTISCLWRQISCIVVLYTR